MQNFLFENMKDVRTYEHKWINKFHSRHILVSIFCKKKSYEIEKLGSLFTMLLKSTLKIADKESDLSH